MRVVHTVGSLRADHGGPSRSVTALCSGLARQNVDVEIVTQLQRAGEPAPIVPDDERVALHSVAADAGWRAFLPGGGRFGATVAEKMSQGMGLVHDHGMWLPTNHAAVRAARRAGVPLVISTRGMLAERALQFNAPKKKAAWTLYQHRDLQAAHLLHATAQQEVDDIRRRGLMQPVALISNGVEIPDTLPTPYRGESRKVLYLSRIHPIKGVENLVRAWAQVRPAGWELVLAGPDERGHRAEVERVIQALSLESVTWAGEVNDQEKWDLYYEADLFVLPTFSENFGIVVAEALASGLPAITTTGAPWTVLEERHCGWWIDTGVDPLVAALREATSLSDERRTEMGRRGRAYVEEKLSWAHVAAEMKAVYAWMLGQGKRPASVVVT